MYCLCKCGEIVTSGKKFRSGHNARISEYTSGQFQKGHIPWIAGLTQDTDSRVANIVQKSKERAMGNQYALGHTYVPSENLRQRYTEEYKGQGNPFFGKHHTLETKQKISKSGSGKPKEQHWNWQGGKSFEVYDEDFSYNLKKHIRSLTNFSCFLCHIQQKDLTEALSVHHIDENKKRSIVENLVPLCRSCHIKAHRRYYILEQDWIVFLKDLKGVYN
tara:strand:+ start:9527 stop:10180 length:654 start_codon:yes stop_codon:yes gene_type:complete